MKKDVIRRSTSFPNSSFLFFGYDDNSFGKKIEKQTL